MIKHEIILDEVDRGYVTKEEELLFLAMLCNVADIIRSKLPNKNIDPVLIHLRAGGPVTYPKERDQPYHIILPQNPHAHGWHIWHFLQEIVHIYSNYENTNLGVGDMESRHCWLDECITTSIALDVLGQIANNPPSTLKAYQESAKACYFNEIKQLTDLGISLAGVIQQNKEIIEGDAHYVDRTKSILELVDFFKADQSRYSIIAYFNLAYEKDESAEEKAKKWYYYTPTDKKSITEEFLKIMGLDKLLPLRFSTVEKKYLGLEKKFIEGNFDLSGIEGTLSLDDKKISGDCVIKSVTKNELELTLKLFEATRDEFSFAMRYHGKADEYTPFMKFEGLSEEWGQITSETVTITSSSIGEGILLKAKVHHIQFNKASFENLAARVYGVLPKLAFRPKDNALLKMKHYDQKVADNYYEVGDNYYDYLNLNLEKNLVSLRSSQKNFKLLLIAEPSVILALEDATLYALSLMLNQKIEWRSKLSTHENKVSLSLYSGEHREAGFLSSIAWHDTTDSHIDVLSKFIRYYIKNSQDPKIDRLRAYLDYFWYACETRNPLIIIPIICFTVEGLIDNFFEKDVNKHEQDAFGALKSVLLKIVEDTSVDVDLGEDEMLLIKKRLKGAISNIHFVTTFGKFRALKEKHPLVFTKLIIDTWDKHRNSLLHGNIKYLVDLYHSNPNEVLRDWAVLVGAVHKIVFDLIGYESSIKDFESLGWPLKVFQRQP